ncbi:unnamed protein product [Sphagnum troendelagicum]|uniref:Uncharacterized protein n=1 Tax=Sphagnum jensenii TaxID=128206 RepID=A0ABP0W7E5_9BRYO
MVEEKRRGAWGAGKSGQPCRPPWRSLSEGRLAAPLTTPVPPPSFHSCPSSTSHCPLPAGQEDSANSVRFHTNRLSHVSRAAG